MNLCSCGCGEYCKITYKKGHARKGKPMSPAHKEKIAAANRGKKRVGVKGRPGRAFSDEERARHSEMAKARGFGKWMSGRTLSPETVAKVSAANKGRVVSESTRQKISEKNSGLNNGMFGRNHDEHAKNMISEAATRMWEREDIRERISTPEYQNRMAKMNRLVKNPRSSYPEELVAGMLDSLGVNYKRQLRLDILDEFPVDFFVEDKNLVIECDGIYWHHYPIGLDKDRERTRLMEDKGIRVLRLWEHEIISMDEHVLSKIITLGGRSFAEHLPIPNGYASKIKRCIAMFADTPAQN